MTIYNVYHVYDVCDSDGVVMYGEDYVASFESEMDAKAFVKKYSKPYVYGVGRLGTPLEEKLHCNEFIVRESILITHGNFDINDTPKDFGVFIPDRRE